MGLLDRFRPKKAPASAGPSWFNPNFGQESKPEGTDAIIPQMYQAWGAYGYQPSITWYQLCNMYVSWEYTAIEKIAKTIASLPPKLYRYENVGTGKTVKPYAVKSMLYGNYGLSGHYTKNAHKVLKESGIKRVEVDAHPFLDLVNRPNPDTVRFDFWRLLAIHLELDGAVGIYKARPVMGNPTELYILPATWTGQFKPIPDLSGVRLIKGYKLIDQNLHTEFSPEEIIWPHYSSLRNPYEGMSAIKAQLYAFNTDQYLNQQLTAFYKNGAMFSNMFETEQNLTPEQYKQISGQLSNYQGAKNAFQKFILHSGLKVSKPMNTTAREAMVQEVESVMRDKILSAHDMSAGKLGLTAQQNRSNLEVVDMGFFNECIRPRAMLITEYFDQFLVKNYDENLDFEFDYPHFEDRELSLKERESNLRTGYSSINEERDKEGLPPVEGGDLHYVSAMGMPIEPSAQPVEPVLPEVQTEVSPEEEEAAIFEPPVKPETKPEAVAEEKPKSLETKGFWTPEKKALAWKKFNRIASSYEPLFKKAFNKHLSSVRAQVVDRIEKDGVKIKSNIAAMGYSKRKSWLAENKSRITDLLPPVSEVKADLKKSLKPIYLGILKDVGEARMKEWASEIKKTKAAASISIQFNTQTPNVKKWLANRLEETSKSITKTTLDTIKDDLREDFENGESQSTMVTHLHETLTEGEAYRAELVARTESTASYNQGDIEGIRQLGVEDRVGKVWLAETDERVRETHAVAAERYSDGYDADTGNPMRLEDKFEVGSDSMVVPATGSIAEENVNCRCGLVYEILPAAEGESETTEGEE